MINICSIHLPGVNTLVCPDSLVLLYIWIRICKLAVCHVQNNCYAGMELADLREVIYMQNTR